MRRQSSRKGAAWTRVALALALLTALIPTPTTWAQSQASTGQLAGSIVDTSGASVRGATVTAKNTETGLEQTSETNDEGLFKFVLLPPGTYTLTANAAGFQSATTDEIQVVVGRTNDVALTLGAGGVAEEVTVTAGAVEVQTTRSEPDAVLNEAAIENLPINGRRFTDFVTLTPSAQVEPSRQQISLAGQKGINGNVNVDGADYNNPFFGGIKGGERGNFAFTIPQESIREFQVVPSGYSAEFGRSTGGIVNAVTKSGTNDWHGSAFYLLRHKELARQNEFLDTLEERDPRTPADDRDLEFNPTQQQFGGSFGGPIAEDKVFFFVSAEKQLVDIPRLTAFDGLQGFVPTADTQEGFDFYRSIEGGYQATNDAFAILGRVDVNVNDNNRFNVRYNFSTNEGQNDVTAGGFISPVSNRAVDNFGIEQDRTHTVVFQMTNFFTPTLVHELRSQYAYEKRPRFANTSSPNVTTFLGEFGARNFLPTTQDDKRFQVADNVTISTGNHTVKFGGEYNYVTAFQTFGFNQFGAYVTTSAAFDAASTLELIGAGGSVADRFDNRSAQYRRQIGNLEAEINSHEIAFFAQDSWRVRPNFTLNFGLRYEAQLNSAPEANNTDLVDQVRGFEFPVGAVVDPTIIPDSTKQWAPRLGFAYDPFNDSRTVIRGFGGIYYARSPLLIFGSPVNNFRTPPGDVTITLPFPVATGQPATLYDQLALIGIDLNSFPLGSLPDISPEQAAQIASALGLSPDPFLGASVTLVSPDFENPRSYQAGIGVERQIAEGLTVGADFLYVKTVHLQRNRQLNLPAPVVSPTDPTGRPIFLPTGAVRPIPTLRDVTVRESSAKSLYRGLTISGKFQRSWGQFNAFYTLSKNLSDDDNERDSGGALYQDLFNLADEYNYSNLDRRHQFVASPLFNLPYGFEVSSSIRLYSGSPVDARIGFDANRDTNNNDRPFRASGVSFLRNEFRNEPIYNVDLRAQYRLGLDRFGGREDQSIKFTVEFFNLFNFANTQIRQQNAASVNFCSPAQVPGAPPGTLAIPADCGFNGSTNVNFLQLREQNPASPNFGRLLTGNTPGTPFQTQVGIRYEF